MISIDSSSDFNLATNAQCHYTGHASIADGTLRMCEFAILNKANTHETRVHHVETPARILAGDSDVGPVGVSELQLAINNGDAVSGYQPPDDVNLPVVYSVAFLATMSNKHKRLARQWVDFLHSPEGVQIYVDGGFSAPSRASVTRLMRLETLSLSSSLLDQVQVTGKRRCCQWFFRW